MRLSFVYGSRGLLDSLSISISLAYTLRHHSRKATNLTSILSAKGFPMTCTRIRRMGIGCLKVGALRHCRCYMAYAFDRLFALEELCWS